MLETPSTFSPNTCTKFLKNILVENAVNIDIKAAYYSYDYHSTYLPCGVSEVYLAIL